MTIYRVLGQEGRITIPFAIRMRTGFKENDILSFTENTKDNTVVIRREKVCDNCITKDTKVDVDVIVEAIKRLSMEQKKAALTSLMMEVVPDNKV